jgi:RNA polymerase sigma-70 factor (ECF subfamily)
VIGCSLAEISELLDATVGEIKAALHRGPTRLRELSKSVAAAAPAPLDEQERELLARYVERFNARDYDVVRTMLADEVRLDLISGAKLRGVAEVGVYFEKYEQVDDWRLALGIVEGRLAILVDDPRDGSPHLAFFMLIAWDAGQVSGIRDYRYARYVLRDAAIVRL